MSFRIAMVEPVTSVGGIVNSAPRASGPLVVGIDAVGVEHGRGLALLEDRLPSCHIGGVSSVTIMTDRDGGT